MAETAAAHTGKGPISESWEHGKNCSYDKTQDSRELDNILEPFGTAGKMA